LVHNYSRFRNHSGKNSNDQSENYYFIWLRRQEKSAFGFLRIKRFPIHAAWFFISRRRIMDFVLNGARILINSTLTLFKLIKVLS